MKKSVYTFLAVFFFMLLLPKIGHAQESVPLFLNGKSIVSEVPAQNIKGTTMVPIRVISEQLGAKVEWNDKEKKISVTKASLNIQMQMDNKKVNLNDKIETLIAAPLNVKGKALLPLRFLAESLGLKVTWNEETKSVHLSKIVIEKPVVIAEKPAAIILPNDTNEQAVVNDSSVVTDNQNGQNQIPIEKITEIQTIDYANDQIIVRANGDLHPTLFYLSSPDRLVVDFQQSVLANNLNFSNKPAITGDLNIGTDLTAATPLTDGVISTPNSDYTATTNGFTVTSSVYIDKVRYANFSDKPPTVRVVIDLKQRMNYQLVEDKENHLVIITSKVVPYTVVLDAGHGGKDTGAISINQRLEKDFNLAMILKIQALLAKEDLIQVVLTRKDDTFVELDERAAIANNLAASLFVSVHGNSYMKSTNGTETYYYRDESLSFAQTMHPHVVEATGFKDKKVKKEKFRVVSITQMPAILLEIGYLSNAEEEASMYDDAFQNRVAASIAAGIKDYLHIQ